jgi:MFS family permease
MERSLPENEATSRKWQRFSVTGFFFLAGLCFSSWASRIPDIKDQLHLSDAQLGNVLFALPVGLMVSLPLSGWMVARFGSRTMVITGAILYSLTLCFIGFVSTAWQLAGVLFVFGLWGNLQNIAVNTQAVGVEAIYGRSIMASFHGAWSIAAFSGAAIAFFLVSTGLSILAHFVVITGLIFAIILISYRNLIPGTSGGASQSIFSWPDKALLKLGLIGFFGMASEGAMFDWSGVYFHSVVHPPDALTPLGFVAFMSTMACGRFVGDALTNKIGRKKMLQLSGILIALGLGLSVVLPTIFGVITGFLLVGFGVSSVVPLVYGAAGKSSTFPASVALAAVSSISFFGFLLGPPVIGWIAQTASLQYSFALIAVVGLCITLLTSLIKTIE